MADNPRAEVDFFANFSSLIRDAQRAGGRAGDQFGDRFTRDANGRLRDARGRYASAGADGGRAYGEGFSDAAADEVDSGGGGLKGKLGGVIGGLGMALAGGAALAGVGVGAAFVTGFQQAIDEEAQQGKFAAQLGGSPDFAKRMGEISSRMYRDAWGESLAEVQTAMRGVLQGGILAEDAGDADIERVTGKVLALSEAFDQDLAGATEAISQIIRNGLAPDADAALDILTRGFQQGADRSGDLLDTFTEYSPLFKDLGIDAASMTGILDQGLGAGARNADLVADAFKEFGIRAQDGSELSQQAFADLGLSGEEMARKIAAGGPEAAAAVDEVLDRLRGIEDPVKRNATAVALFGTQAEDLGESLFAIDPSEASKALGEVGGSADKVGENLTTTQDKIEAFKRKALGGLADFVGERVLPALQDLADAFQTGEGEGFFADLGRTAREAYDWIVNTAVPEIRSAMDSLTAGFQGENDGSLFGNLGELARDLLPVIKDIGSWIVNTGIPAWVRFLGVMADIQVWMVNTAIPIWQEVARVAQDVWTRVSTAVQTAWGFIQPIFSAIWSFITTTLIPTLQMIWTISAAVFAGVWTVIQMAWGIIGPIFSSIVGYLAGAFTTGFNNARTTVETVFSAVWSAVQWAWGVIEPIFSGIVGYIDDTLRPAWDRIAETVGSVFDKIPGAIGNALRIAGNVVAGFLRGAGSIADTVGLDDLAGSLREAAGSADKWGEATPSSSGGGGGGAWHQIARGGYIKDSWGEAGKDSVPAMLMPGEVVIRKSSVDKYGVKNLLDLNEGRIPGFANGGALIRGAKFLMGKGARISEHPMFGGVGGSHARGGYHYSNASGTGGDAFDANFGPGGQSASEMRFFDQWAPALRDMGLRVLWRVKDHFNHLHADIGSGGGGGGISGAISGVVDKVTQGLRDIAGGALDRLPKADVGKGLLGLPGGGVNFLRQKIIDFIKGQAGSVGSMGGAAVSGSARAIVQQLAARRGWVGGEWAALDRLIQKESSWNPNAANPTSSARGLFQKMTSIHGPLERTIAGQADWGFNYIAGRYGSPSAALAFHDRNNWYANGGLITTHPQTFDSGGVLAPGYNLVKNMTGKDEPLVPAGGGGLQIHGDVVLNERAHLDAFMQQHSWAMRSGSFT